MRSRSNHWINRQHDMVSGVQSCELDLTVPYDFYVFYVRQQLNNGGDEYKPFKSSYNRRIIPCTRGLANILTARKEKLKEKFGFSEQAMEDMPIIWNEKTKVGAIVAPRKLDAFCRKIIVGLGLPERIISIPDSRKGTKEINLRRYQGDFFRSNFQYYALNVAFLEVNELAYLLGNRNIDTLSVHYIDFSDDGILYWSAPSLCTNQ